MTQAELSGDGDAVIEPGEVWALTIDVANPGVLPVSGTMHLTSPSPYITVLQADASFSAGAQVFATAQPAGPAHLKTVHGFGIEIAVAPNAPLGTTRSTSR